MANEIDLKLSFDLEQEIDNTLLEKERIELELFDVMLKLNNLYARAEEVC